MENAYSYILNDIGLSYGNSIVVACSGGPDSMALLHTCIRVKKALDIQIVCAHVNHNVRKESESEKILVQTFCHKNGLVFEYMKIDEYGDDNFENEARTKRYSYFSKILKKYNAKFLFTAHHGDDLIETILMRIVRGSTLRGYSGFSKVVDKGCYKIIRPLIECTKKELISYNKKHKIEYVIDKTNYEDVHTRNRYRKYILPKLKKEDNNVHLKFYKFSKILLEYNEYIEDVTKKELTRVYVQNVLNIDEFLKLDKVIGMKIIYYILECQYQDDLMLITDRHAELIYQLVTSNKANMEVYLPNNIKAIKAYGSLTLAKQTMGELEYEIDINKHVNLPNGKNIEVIDKTEINDNNICRLSSDDICLPLRVRTRHDGDKMYIKGMVGSKKIKDIFIDSKINMHDRMLWPIVLDSKGVIVWIPGLKKSKFDRKITDKCDIIMKYY